MLWGQRPGSPMRRLLVSADRFVSSWEKAPGQKGSFTNTKRLGKSPSFPREGPQRADTPVLQHHQEHGAGALGCLTGRVAI